MWHSRVLSSLAHLTILVMGLGCSGSVNALSLKSSKAQALLGDFVPGMQSRSDSLQLENVGNSESRIECKAAIPPTAELIPGYEPWLDIDHVKVNPTTSRLPAGAKQQVELDVSIPKNKHPDEGQYQFDLVTTGQDPSGALLTLKTKVLLSIGESLASANDVTADWVLRPEFSLSPPHAEQSVELKMINASDQALEVTLSPAQSWNEELAILDGYMAAPNPRWLRFDKRKVQVRPSSIERVRIWTEVPAQKRYDKQKWAFVVAVDALAQNKKSRRYFVLYTNQNSGEAKRMK